MAEEMQVPALPISGDLIRRKLFTLAGHYEASWRPEVERLLPLVQQIPGWLDKAGMFIPGLRPARLPDPFPQLLSLCRTFSVDQWQPHLMGFLVAIPDDRLISVATWLAGVGPWLVDPAAE